MHHFRGLTSKLTSSFPSKERQKKEQYYLKNGSVVLEELIALCDGKSRIPLRYFSAIEIERPIEHSEKSLYTYGRHMVKGLLDKRFVLVSFAYDTFTAKYSNYICHDIAITSQMSHLNNVLKLIGCCLEYAVPVLVYEYVEVITLHDLLFDARNSSLSWESRLRIANAIASAILYLHSEFTTPIIYVDLHLQKVLIDQSSGVAKLFDFSLSISLPPGELEAEAQVVHGTCGYLDPEYVRSGIVTQKTDVFGFGVILFQLLTGKRTFIFNIDPYNASNIEECNIMDIVDPAILEENGIEIRQQLEDCLDLVKRCTLSNGEDRPYMIHVAKEIRQIEKCFRALTQGLN
ncbi:PREDICTED: non-functional pseudokinase ZED1-like [Nicotiana attenuata]|uniref:Wall-associated receptor kinase 4 n=1 Tax=Nicotiana attenuata TaxID=49451 RepID=A0A314KQ89_NICAT|nr:PREDICTED: non-functional pseudokinase ZED1-like [Nicotiana attenuata]OIT31488.1 wall-associated receptor kinase 4 [Nicotiana attenuata]